MKNKIIGTILISTLALAMVGCGLEQARDDGPKETFLEKETEIADEADEAESTEENVTDKDVKIEVVEGYTYSDEYKEEFAKENRGGFNFQRTTDSEVSEFSDWKEGYTSLIKDLEENKTETVEYALIYVDEDDRPELAYKLGDTFVGVASFADTTVNIYGIQKTDVSYVEKKNVLYGHEEVGAAYYDYVGALNNNYWVDIASCERKPLDEWAEDSFDENGKPIISYWSINGNELSSDAEFDETLAKYVDKSFCKPITGYTTAEDVLAQIEAIE